MVLARFLPQDERFFDYFQKAAENAAEMVAAAAAVATGEVTRASRDVELEGVAIRGGAWLGLADGEPVVGGDDFADVAFEVVGRLQKAYGFRPEVYRFVGIGEEVLKDAGVLDTRRAPKKRG